MTAVTSLGELLAGLRPASPAETDDVAAIAELVATGDPWDRRLPLHLTCSALIVHPPTQRVLLRWHERQQSWLQVGGHADPGETDPLAIAQREGIEETGLTDLFPWPVHTPPALVHVVVVPVPANRREPAHHHGDLRFLLATERPDEVIAESQRAPLRWLSIDDARRLTAEDNVRESLDRVAGLLRAAS